LIAALLAEVSRLRIDLWVEGDALRYRSVHGEMSADLQRAIKTHKAELIQLLRDAQRLTDVHGARKLEDDEVPMTASHAWYLETFDPSDHDWALTFVLECPGEVSPGLLNVAANILLQKHDVFRLRFARDADNRWRLKMVPTPGEVHLTTYNMAGLDASHRLTRLHEAGYRLRRSLDILKGPVFALSLCAYGGTEGDKVLMALHRHVVDAYSMQKVFEELLGIYQALAAGQEPERKSPFLGYREYLFRLYNHTHQLTFARDALFFWRSPERQRFGRPLPVDMPGGRHTDLNSRNVRSVLDSALMRHLRNVRLARGVLLHELLLYSLARSFRSWTDEPLLRLDFEQHGRGCLGLAVNLLGTIGPMTIKFPMVLDCDREGIAGLTAVRDSIRGTIDQGLGYGFLRYRYADLVICREMAACPPAQIFFNNRINLTTRPNAQPEVRTRGLPRVEMKMMESPVSSHHENLVSYDLMIDCEGSSEFAVVNWIYSSAIHREETINALSKRFLGSLRALQ
jgi:hypothetical protein